MPGGNGMGPTGQGPRTGRGMGWCGGTNTREDRAPGGRGSGMGRGGGRRGGWRHRHCLRATGLTGWQRAQMGWSGPGVTFTSGVSEVKDVATMKQQATNIEQLLGELRASIEKLEKVTASKTEKEQL